MNVDVPFHDWPSQRRFMLGSQGRGRDIWTAWEGREGAGKTTNATHAAIDLKPDFDLERQAIFNIDQLLEALDKGKKREIYLVDEAANIFYNRDWNTWTAKALTKIGRQMRIMESIWLLAMPDFSGLDMYVREERVLIRNYQPPYYDSDGISNGPSKMMFQTERFDYKEQARAKRWVDVYDYEVGSLDARPEWNGYADRKEDNFKELVREVIKRRKDERTKAEKANKKPAKGKTAKAAT